MTTLPQTTTPMRVQRQGSGLAYGGGQNGSIAPVAAVPQMTAADVWRVIRSNMWLIIGSVILFGVAGYFANSYLQAYHPKYEANGVMQIQPQMNQDPLSTTPVVLDQRALEIEQRTQAKLLLRESLIGKLFDNPESKIRQSDWFRKMNNDVEAAKNAMASKLAVTPVPDTKLILLSVRDSDPKDAATILQAIGDQHIKDQQAATRNDRLKRSTRLSTLKEQYTRRLSEIASDLRQRAVQLNLDGLGAPGRLSVKEIELQNLVDAQMNAAIKLNEAKSILDSVANQIQRGETPAAVAENVQRDQVVLQYQQQLLSLQMALGETGATGTNHPRQRAAEERLAAMERKLDQVREEKIATQQMLLIDELRSKVQSAETDHQAISTRVDKMKEEMGTLSNSMNVYLMLKEEEALTREQLQKVNDELDKIRIPSAEADAGAVTWYDQPIAPDKPEFPKLPITMALAIMAGLGLSLGIAFLRELTDTSVRSPRDIQRVGQMTLLGMVPHEDDDPQAAGARLPLVIFDSPQSVMADQLRQIRTRLQYAASLDTTRSIMVTSSSMGDGKTTIACNLATGLALNGRKILLVDADFRRPELHKVFELDNAKGFGDVLAAPDTFDSVVKPSMVPNLSILPSGPKPPNSTELLESQLLIDFIDRVLEDYDHVIFDTGSVMMVSESMALAPRVDGVITVTRARNNSRGLLGRMRDTLRQLKAEHLGVILNGVRAQNGGYYGQNIKTYYEYQNA